MSRSRDPLSCARFIAEMMRNRGISQAEMARRLGQASNGFVNLVLKGERPIPADDANRWIELLELTPEQAALFKRYAIRSYGTECANEFVDALDDAVAENAALSRELDMIRTAWAAIQKHVDLLERRDVERLTYIQQLETLLEAR